MADDSEQLYKIDGSKVWLSPTALEFAQQYFGPGRQGRERFARYLLARERLGDDYQLGDADDAAIFG